VKPRRAPADRIVTTALALLAAASDVEQALADVARLLVPTFADWCTVELIESNGSIWRVGQIDSAAEQPASSDLAEAASPALSAPEEAPSLPLTPSELAVNAVLRRVVESGQTISLRATMRTQVDVERGTGPSFTAPTASAATPSGVAQSAPVAQSADEQPRLLAVLGSTSLLAVPLLVRGAVIGAIILGRRGHRRRFPASQLGLIEDLARRAALTVDNTRLFRESQAMRERARRVVDRLRRLEGLTAALTAAITPAEVAHVVVDLGVEAFGASAGVLVVPVDDEPVLEIRRVVGYGEAEVLSWRRIPLDAPAPLAEAARTGAPVWIESSEARTTRYPGLGPTSGRHAAWASVPMVTEGRVVGVLGLSFREARTHDDGEWELLRAVAQQGALALERSRLYEATEQAHAEARDALETRDAFLSVAAHELRTPITGLRAFATLLQGKLREDEPLDLSAVRRGLAAIDRQSTKLTTLVTQLLDVAQLEGGQLRLTRVRADVAALVSDAVEHQRVIVSRHDLVVSAPEPILADVDALRLEQVLANLIGNAAKFSPPSSTIEIDVAREADWARISVRDYGPGVAPEIAARIFERYTRHEGPHNPSGLGLGLFITREIAWLHGGNVTVEQPDGGGARFVVRLPLIASP
jgi:signal transduction histidine kinase